MIYRLPSTVSLNSLMALMSTDSIPNNLRKTISFYLSKIILKPNGIKSLIIVLKASSEILQEDDPLPSKQIDMISNLLCTVPKQIKCEKSYFRNLTQQLLLLLDLDGIYPSCATQILCNIARKHPSYKIIHEIFKPV